MYIQPQISGPNRNQYRNNKGNYFYRINNANSIGIQRKFKNMLEYRSDSKYFKLIKIFLF